MSQRLKSWLKLIRKTYSSSTTLTPTPTPRETNKPLNKDTHNTSYVVCLENTASDCIALILTFLNHSELHRIRLVSKQWNILCDRSQNTLKLSTSAPAEQIKYWMLKLRNLRRVYLSHNMHINDLFIFWLQKEYLPLKLKQKNIIHLSDDTIWSEHWSENNRNGDTLSLDIHFDLSHCFGISQSDGSRYLKKLMNCYSRYGITINIFGNFRLIDPSRSLQPEHVVLLQLYSLKFGEVEHCFKFGISFLSIPHISS